MIRVVSVISLLLIFGGCTFMPGANTSAVAQDQTPKQISLQEAEDIPGVVVEERKNPPKLVELSQTEEYYEVDNSLSENDRVRGFRVQIFTTESKSVADSIAQEARKKLDMEVYNIFMSPYYRVRIGNCVTHQEAEELKSEVISRGFEAFIVRAIIEIEEEN